MFIGVLTFELRIDGAFSLKDKRRVIRSLKDRVIAKYNVSIAEVGDNDIWNRGMIAAVCVSSSHAHADTQIQELLRFIDNIGEFWIENVHTEIITA